MPDPFNPRFLPLAPGAMAAMLDGHVVAVLPPCPPAEPRPEPTGYAAALARQRAKPA